LAAECRDPIRRDARRRASKAAAPLADNDVSLVRAFERNLIEAWLTGTAFEFEVSEQRTPSTHIQLRHDMNPTTEL